MKNVPLEGAQSTLRAVIARGIAAALITGIDQAVGEGRPLTQVQQIDMATMAVMSYADAIRDGENGLEAEAGIAAEMKRRRAK